MLLIGCSSQPCRRPLQVAALPCQIIYYLASPCAERDTEHRYVLKNLVRDWSAEGAAERSQSYGRMLTELTKRLGPAKDDQPPPNVLVPGAGLGRLCLEIAALGYHAQVKTPRVLFSHRMHPGSWHDFAQSLGPPYPQG